MLKEYISNSWELAVTSKRTGKLKLPFDFVPPCITGEFRSLYYWDTYLINKGLILDGKVLLAKNNVDDLIFALDYFGCVPNYTRDNGADWCSQPPFLALMIKDIDASIKDAEWLATAILKLENEYKFWMDNRFTKSGLNQYGTNKKTERGLAWYYDHVVCKRIAFTDKLTIKQKAERAKNFIAEAESGEDFTPRYNNHNAMQMNQIDLNSHIFGIEQLLYSYYQGKDEEKYQFYKQQADKRVELLKSLCFDKESNLFYDYNFEEETISKRLCAACFLPYYYKIAENGDGLLKLYGVLKSKGGVFACEDVGDNAYQWGYPNIWAPHQYFAFVALKNYGFEKEANELRNNYMNLLEGEFNRTGKIWERYDEDGVAKSLEYETQPMLGWTAGVYNYFWADKHSK